MWTDDPLFLLNQPRPRHWQFAVAVAVLAIAAGLAIVKPRPLTFEQRWSPVNAIKTDRLMIPPPVYNWGANPFTIRTRLA